MQDLILCFREIEELKSGNKDNDNASINQIEALRMELDQKEKLNSSRIRELEATVKKLEKENSKLKENEVDPPQTEDIGTVYCFLNKLGCVVRMVVDSILIHAESGPNDHRKEHPRLQACSELTFTALKLCICGKSHVTKQLGFYFGSYTE